MFPSVLIWMLTILRGLWALVLVTVCILIYIYMCVSIYVEMLMLTHNLLSHVGSVFSRNSSVKILNSWCLNRMRVHVCVCVTTQNVVWVKFATAQGITL